MLIPETRVLEDFIFIRHYILIFFKNNTEQNQENPLKVEKIEFRKIKAWKYIVLVWIGM